jgi:hypothetical protein
MMMGAGMQVWICMHGFSVNSMPQGSIEVSLHQDIDVLVKRNPDETLGCTVYRKPTHTDLYVHASNHHHHPSQKCAVLSIDNLPMDV